jgi:hypothetical protein
MLECCSIVDFPLPANHACFNLNDQVCFINAVAITNRIAGTIHAMRGMELMVMSSRTVLVFSLILNVLNPK